MPIKGLTDNKRLPRVGKLHLGVKAKSARGVEYPKAVDYFVVHAEKSTSEPAAAAFREVYGDEPRELDIMFPTDDVDQWADASYKAYSQTWGLICKGDGETALARWDNARNGARPAGIDTGTWAHRETKAWVYLQIPCAAVDCPMQKTAPPRCKAVMSLQFLLPRVRGIGIWQIDTGSWNSIRNIRDNVDLIKATTGGRIRGLPLRLSLAPLDIVRPDVSSKRVHVLNIYTPLTLESLLHRVARLPADSLMRLPEPDEDEPPEDLFPAEVNGQAVEVSATTGEIVDDAGDGVKAPALLLEASLWETPATDLDSDPAQPGDPLQLTDAERRML